MNRHPGGEEHTVRLLRLAGLSAGSKILDMGAGDGSALLLMRQYGYAAVGIDLEPQSDLVQKGDFLHTDYPDESFDGILSQCAFFVSGDASGAICEARRLLRPKGVLMLSDVFFSEPTLPGFRILHKEDMTPVWRAYYLETLWREETACECLPRGKCRYLSIIAAAQ